jgi:Flp pilus assembly protein CpaB
MTTRKIILLAIASVLLVYVAFFIKPPPKPEEEIPYVPVMVANRDIPPYTLLTANDVTTRLVPPEQATDSLDSAGSVQDLMTTQEVRYGNIVRRSTLLKPDAAWVDEETLIFSFYVSTSRIVGGQLRPGHYVDLLVTRPEQRDRPAETLWIAHDLWVVGVYQASGSDVSRPTATFIEQSETTSSSSPGGAFGLPQSGATLNVREGPANLVVLAAHRDTGRLIADYLGAQLFEPWVYIRPGPLSPDRTPLARIDGIVFEDRNADKERQSDEAGMGQIRVALYGQDGYIKEEVQTAPDGTFLFRDLAPGSYTIAHAVPEGYVAVSADEVKLELVGGQNRHLRFAITALVEPTPTPKPTAAPVQAMAVATPIHTEVSSPTPLAATPAPDLGPCTYRVYMSEEKDGPELKMGRTECVRMLWAVVEFNDCDRLEYSAHISSQTLGEVLVGSSTWLAGSGKQSFQVSALQPDRDGYFGADRYTTFVKTSGQGDILPYSWEVYRPPQGCTGARFPATSFGFERPSAASNNWVVLDANDIEVDMDPPEAEAVEADTPPRALFGFDRGR